VLDFGHHDGETEACVRAQGFRGAMRVTAWLAAVGWMGVIFGLSSVPGSQIPGRWGPLGHFGEYAILGALLLVALGLPKYAVAAASIASAYGVTDELHQLFVPGRHADPVDWLVDTLGAIAGVFVITRIYHALRSRTSAGEA